MNKLLKLWYILTPITQKIGLLISINLLINIGLYLIPSFVDLPIANAIYDKEIIIHQVKRFVLFQDSNDDSWMPMQKAFDYVKVKHETPLYDEIFFNQKVKFQYPPSSLLVFSFLNSIDGFLKAIGQSWSSILKYVSWISVVVMIYFVIKIFNFSFAENIEPSKSQSNKIDLITRNIFLVILGLTFYPVMLAHNAGQIQVWINTLFSVLFWCWLQEKKATSGVIAGIMCLIKPQYSIILIWAILRKQLSFAAAMGVTIFSGLLVSILVFGITDNLNYLSVLSFISKHGEAYYPNHSMNGLLNRLLFNGDNLNFDQNSFPPFNLLVYLGTLITSIAFLALALYPPKMSKEKGSTTDMAIFVLTSTIASPVAWEHHYGIILPIYAFLLPCLLKRQIFGKFTIPYLCLSYILASNYFAIARQLANLKVLNILQSYLFFAALMVLTCLYVLRSEKTNKNENLQFVTHRNI
jgi:alpha-1,2-mannosyltransferase